MNILFVWSLEQIRRWIRLYPLDASCVSPCSLLPPCESPRTYTSTHIQLQSIISSSSLHHSPPSLFISSSLSSIVYSCCILTLLLLASSSLLVSLLLSHSLMSHSLCLIHSPLSLFPSHHDQLRTLFLFLSSLRQLIHMYHDHDDNDDNDNQLSINRVHIY